MQQIKLGAIIQQIRGVSYKPTDVKDAGDPNAVALLRANNIQDSGLNFEDLVYVDKQKVSADQMIRKGDILICASSGSKNLVGKAAVADCDLPYAFGAFCKIVRVKAMDAAFVGQFFQSPRYRREISAASAGANINNIRNEHIDNMLIAVYSGAEQREIAKKLLHIDNLIRGRQEQLVLIDQLVKSRFIELFGDLKANPKGWPIVPFLDFAEIDGNMTTDYEKYADYPHIGIDSIEKGTGELKGYRTVREDGVISGKYIFTPQHIIYSKIRPNLNKVALPNFDGLCSADAYPILPNCKNCNRVFLAVAMRSEYYLEYILQFSSRTNLPKVNRKEIAGFRMPLPPLALQEQFAAFVEQTDKSKYYSYLCYHSCLLAAQKYRQEWMSCLTLHS